MLNIDINYVKCPTLSAQLTEINPSGFRKISLQIPEALLGIYFVSIVIPLVHNIELVFNELILK